MYVPELRYCACAVAVLFVTGCAGGMSSARSQSPSGSALPATVSRAATTTSLSSCSTKATAQGVPGGSSIVQADPINANDMWFTELGNGVDVARYNPGGAPTTVLHPFPNTQVTYAYIQAFSDNDIWVVANLQSAVPPFLIAHWNGSSWRQVTLNGTNASYFYPAGLSGLATNDLWMTGSVGTGSGGGHMALAHWNGTTFSIVGVSPYGNGAGPVLEVAPSNVWATATSNASNVILAQWNGSRFTFDVLPPPPGETNATTIITQIAATAPNNVWAIGQHSNNGTTIDGRIWRYNGSWQPYSYTPATGSVAIFEGVAPLDATRTIITAAGQYVNQGTITYGYSGATRFHSIPNDLPAPNANNVGPDAAVPGTSTFWMPAPASNAVDLVSCS